MFGKLLTRYAKSNPDGIAIIYENQRITWKQFNKRVNSLANALIDLGIGKGDKGAILLHNCPEFLEAHFALQKIGAIPVPLNFRYVSKEVEYVMNNSDSVIIVFGEGFLDIVNGARQNMPDVKKYVCVGKKTDGALDYEELISSYSHREPGVEVTENDIAVICYTGGTTGMPKGVVLSYRHMLRDLDFFLQMLVRLLPKAGKEEPKGEFGRRVNIAFEALFDGLVTPLVSGQQFSGKTVVIRSKESVTISVRDGKLKFYCGEVEDCDLLIIWNGDLVDLTNVLVPSLCSKSLLGSVKMFGLLLSGKIKIQKSKSLGMQFLRMARKTLKGKESQTKNLSVPPMFHLAAYMEGLVTWVLTASETLVFTKSLSFDPKEIMELIEREKPQIVLMVPTMWKRIIDYPEMNKYDTSGVAILMSGAAVLPAKVKKSMLEAFPNALLVDAFGQTEMAPVTTVKFDGSAESVMDRCVGKPLPGVEVRIIDESGKDVKPGDIGEIIYKSETIMKEYYKDQKRTAEVIRDGWFYSGDLGKFDAEGNLFVIDRKRECITSGGEKIYPYEVEDIIRAHPKVKDICIIGVPDEEWGSSVRAVIQLMEGETATQEEIIEWCRGKMAGYKKPRSVVFVDSFPVSPAEKVLRWKIKEMYGKPLNKE